MSSTSLSLLTGARADQVRAQLEGGCATAAEMSTRFAPNGYGGQQATQNPLADGAPPPSPAAGLDQQRQDGQSRASAAPPPLPSASPAEQAEQLELALHRLASQAGKGIGPANANADDLTAAISEALDALTKAKSNKLSRTTSKDFSTYESLTSKHVVMLKNIFTQCDLEVRSVTFSIFWDFSC
eukprot:SAG31_NODE_2980_length_4829_cov_3.156237_1_plen_184_part_00